MRPSSTKLEPAEVKLVEEILISKFGRDVENVTKLPSNNSNVYNAALKPTTAIPELSKQQSVLPGSEPLPVDTVNVVLRVTTPDACLNDAVVVQNEVAAMSLIRDALKTLEGQLVPRVYGWQAATNDAPGWSLIEFMPGMALSPELFEELDDDAKDGVLEHMARIFKLIQDYELPAAVKGYGGLGFDDNGSIVVGPTPIPGATKRCDTYHELYSEYLQTQLQSMDNCEVVQGWRDTGDLRSRIETFVDKAFEPLLKKASEQHPRQTIVHADFDLHNLLFDPQTNSLIALLDFQFSHIASPADEYFYSFALVHSLVMSSVEKSPVKELRYDLVHGFDESVLAQRENNNGIVNWKVAAATDRAFKKAGVKRPVDMVPGMDDLSQLHFFIQNISPAHLTMPRTKKSCTKEQLERIKKSEGDDVAAMLASWGY